MPVEEQFLSTLREWIETSTHRSIHAFIRHNRESDLSLSQVSTLFRLYHHGPSPINDLAEHLGISMPAVSQFLNHLIEAGLILRSTDPADRRVKLISLTERGVQAVEASKKARHAWVDELAGSLSPPDKEVIMPGLQILINQTQALQSKKDPLCLTKTEKPA